MSNSLSTMGLPQLSVSSSASIAAFFRTISAIANRTRPRCWAAVSFHGPRSNAWRATPIASSTSFLLASVIDFGDVQVAFRVDAHSVHAPESTWKIPPRPPGIHEVAVQIVLDHLRRGAVEGPKISGTVHVNQMNVRWRLAHAPLIKVFAVLVKHLDAAVAAVLHEN